MSSDAIFIDFDHCESVTPSFLPIKLEWVVIDCKKKLLTVGPYIVMFFIGANSIIACRIGSNPSPPIGPEQHVGIQWQWPVAERTEGEHGDIATAASRCSTGAEETA